MKGTSKKLYVVPGVSPVMIWLVAGSVGKTDKTVTKVPTPAAGAVPLVDDNVGVAEE